MTGRFSTALDCAGRFISEAGRFKTDDGAMIALDLLDNLAN